MSLVLELPDVRDQHAVNYRRWEELLTSGEMQSLPQCRVETDRYGHIIMSPWASGLHSVYQSKISNLLDRLMPGGMTFTECPVSTSNGVKLVDAAWMSRGRWEPMRSAKCYREAPEICVEVISPSNTVDEMEEKRMLYAEIGCMEFWRVVLDGAVSFSDGDGTVLDRSGLCPEFPSKIEL